MVPRSKTLAECAEELSKAWDKFFLEIVRACKIDKLVEITDKFLRRLKK